MAKIVVLAGMLGACAPKPPALTWHGEHLSFGQNVNDEVSEGTLEYLDYSTAALKLRAGADPFLRVNYYWVDLETVDEFCHTSTETTACAMGRDAFSTSADNIHELVHAVKDGSHLAIEEGTATAWQTRPSGDDWIDGFRSAEEVIEDLQITVADYLVAGHFVGFLSDMYGEDGLSVVMKETDTTSPRSELVNVFPEAFGVTLDEALAEYSKYPTCSRYGLTEQVAECETPREIIHCSGERDEGFPLQPAKVADEFDLSSDSVRTVGSELTDPLWTTLVIEAPAAGTYEVWVATDLDLEAHLRTCGPGCQFEKILRVRELAFDGAQVPPSEFHLEEGLHVVTLARVDNDTAKNSEVRVHCWARPDEP